MALKNLENGFCVHTLGGWPYEGGTLAYWNLCKGDKFKLDFFNLGLYLFVMQVNGESNK